MKTETFEAAWWKRFIPKPKKRLAKTKKGGRREATVEVGGVNAKKEGRREATVEVGGVNAKKEKAMREDKTEVDREDIQIEKRRGGGPGHANAKCEFEQEMLGEGISLTPAGRNISGEIAKAYLPKYPKCYRKAMMGFFGGDKCQEGIFWVKVTDAQQKAEMKAKAKNMNCDAVETKGAEGLNVNNINMAAEFVHRDLGTKVRSLF